MPSCDHSPRRDARHDTPATVRVPIAASFQAGAGPALGDDPLQPDERAGEASSASSDSRTEVAMSNSPGSSPGAGGTARVPRGGGSGPLTGSGARGSPGRRTWDLGTGDAATVLAEARRALFVMVGFLALIWVIQIANWADHYQLTLDYGIRPHDVGSLPDILSAPFLHVSWAHIEGNSGPLFIFGFLAAYRGVTQFLGVTVLVILTSGLGAWLTESSGT